jgi:hypothetical protein
MQMSAAGQLKLDGDLLLSPGTQDYLFTDQGATLAIQGQTAGSNAVIGLYAKDGDGTDSLNFSIYNLGLPSSVTNSERTLFGYDVSGAYGYLRTLKSGTGTARPLQIYTEAFVDQLVITATGEVGVGIATVGATTLGVQAGSSTNDAAVGGVLVESRTQTGNVGLGEDDLFSYSVPADTLNTDGMALHFLAWGRFAANGNTKRVRARFGSSGTSQLFDSTGLSYSGMIWRLEGTVIRTGAATQRSTVHGEIGSNGGGTASTSYLEANNSLNQTLSGTVALRITGETTTNVNNDIIIDACIVWWTDHNT